MDQYEPTGSISGICGEAALILKERERTNIIEFAAENVRGYDAKLSHLLHKPAHDITSREFREVIYVGPVRTSKSYTLVDCCIAWTQMIDPIDMGVFLPSELIASYFSKKRYTLDLEQAVPGLAGKLRPGPSNNTVTTKIFEAGNMLSYGWPTNNQAASREFGRCLISDLDRMSGDVGGEGSFFDQISKRIRTYLSRGVVVAESSPGKPVTDPDFDSENPHEAPPTTGILGLYNQGNRQIVYGRCPHCMEYFHPRPSPLSMHIPTEGLRTERARNAFLICQNCGGEIRHEHEKEFKRSGRWVGEGQEIDEDGVVHGELIPGKRSSYWQSGWFAAYQTWEELILEHIDAQETFEKTGDEGRLKTSTNANFAAPYLEMSRRVNSSAVHELESRKEDIERFAVPEGVRCLLASVDIQGGKNSRFVVQVHGYGVSGEKWLIDRYDIYQAKDGSRISPQSNIEHWNYIVKKVVNSTYKLPGGRELRVLLTAVDTGGEAGVTERAYEWWRGLKSLGLSKRVWLIKGGSDTNFNAPTVKKAYPDSTERKDRYSGGRGDVPVLILNPTILKDAVWSSIEREEQGPNYFHFPKWLETWWFKELTAETRSDKKWVQVGKRNEAFDLAYYAHALWHQIKGHLVDWGSPPAWCQPMDTNSEVMSKGDRIEMKEKKIKVTRRTRFRFN